MADNVSVTPGTGATLAADDIGGVLYPRTKLTIGADGVDGGDVSASNPLPITGDVGITGTVTIAEPVTVDGTVAVSSSALPTGAATETTLAAINTKVPAQGQAAMAASLPVAIASNQSTLAVNQAGVSATGSLTGNGQAVALSLTGASGWAVDLRGTFTATVQFQGTIDGTNWFTIAMLPAGGTVNVATVTQATAAGAWWGNATGLQQVRATTTAYTSGTITVVVRAMQAAGVVTALPSGATTVPVSGTVTANQGTLTAPSANVLNSAATTNGTVVKASAGTLYSISASNINAAVRYLKLYNSTTVTVGTTTPVLTIAIPATGFVNLQFGATGMRFTTGICIALTTGATDADTGAVAANEIKVITAFI